eukprot:TRINITY_DN60705_c0_g1_i1.p1 TRINITY_DN60705_c0_g1~~TRINITY_DN60705_c0_g1_i1.p1  ORF type:complete len:290 (+),score=68.43 TRINITY_DN60705_c0_g1_i1:75-944(+)
MADNRDIEIVQNERDRLLREKEELKVKIGRIRSSSRSQKDREAPRDQQEPQSSDDRRAIDLLREEMRKDRKRWDEEFAQIEKAQLECVRDLLAAESVRLRNSAKSQSDREASQDKQKPNIPNDVPAIDLLRDEMKRDRERWEEKLEKEKASFETELKQEREAREKAEALVKSNAEMLEFVTAATKNATNAAKELQMQREVEARTTDEWVKVMASATWGRVHQLEAQVNVFQANALGRMAMPERIRHYTNLHTREAGSGYPWLNPGRSGSPFMSANSSYIGVMPLMRRIT